MTRTAPDARPDARSASTVMVVLLSSSEGLLEPFRADVGVDLGVDHQWAVAAPQPRADAFEVVDPADRQAVAARGLREGLEVAVGELGEVDGLALRPEVVDLGAVCG